MRKSLLLLAPYLTMTGCTVHDVKTKSAKVSVSVDKASINSGEDITLTWTAENAASCSRTAGTETTPVPLSGKEVLTPKADTTYLITCSPGGKGKSGSASASVKVIMPAPPTDLFLTIESRDEARKYFDLEGIFEKPCPDESCFIADIESDYFAKDAAGNWTATDAFLKKISIGLSPTVIRTRSASAAFNLEKSSGAYGSMDRLAELGLDQKCTDALSVKEGLPLLSGTTLEKFIEAGTSQGVSQAISSPEVYLDFKAMIAGHSEATALKGAEVTVSYKKGDLTATADAAFEDFESAAGTFVLKNDSTAMNIGKKFWAVLKSLLTENALYAAIFPEGYPVPPAKNGYDYDPMHATCNTASPQRTVERVYQTKTELCQSPIDAGLCCEPGFEQTCPRRWPHTVTKTYPAQPISDYVARVRSKRIYTGPSTIDCKAQFADIARIYKIDGSWTATSNAQYFVFDQSWPSCGANCNERFFRASATDDRRSDVEPSYNQCLDRWSGLDYSSYVATLKADCENTDVYRAAFEAFKRNDADEKFAKDCRDENVCEAAAVAMKSIRASYSLSELKAKVSATEAALAAAKNSGKSLVLSDSQLSAAAVKELAQLTANIKAGLSKAEELRKSTSPEANWVNGLGFVHNGGSIPGFQSFAESSATVAEYEALIGKISALTVPSVREVACSFRAEGRFRKYGQLTVKSLGFQPGESVTVKAPLLSEYSR